MPSFFFGRKSLNAHGQKLSRNTSTFAGIQNQRQNRMLADISTRAPQHLNKDSITAERKELARKIGLMSRYMFAHSQKSLLIVLQGMDASGKNGISRKVFNHVSPIMCSSINFKKPTDLEMSHDFLWRVHSQVPSRGQIKIFNRSHYEDILIQRVHNWIDEDQVQNRMRSINDFERLLQQDNDTIILKFYLHISKERQKEKLLQRIHNPDDHWKHGVGDWSERQHWDKYRACYEDILKHSEAPWHIVPADQKWYRDYFVARQVADTLSQLPQHFPEVDIEMPAAHLLND